MKRAIQVGTGFMKHTFNEALDLSKPGDVIVFDPGTYSYSGEGAILISNITLRGNGKNANDVTLNLSAGLSNDGEFLKVENMTLICQEQSPLFSDETSHGTIEVNQVVIKSASDYFAINAKGATSLQIHQSELYNGGLLIDNNVKATATQSIFNNIVTDGNSEIKLKTNKVLGTLFTMNSSYVCADDIYFEHTCETDNPIIEMYGNAKAVLDNMDVTNEFNEASIFDNSALKVKQSNLSDKNPLFISSNGSATYDGKFLVDTAKLQATNNANNSDNTTLTDNADNTTEKDLSTLSSSKSALEQIHNLIGLSKVKDEIDSFISVAAFNKKRQEQGIKNIKQSFHSLFLGNPGTGKTTVARLLAQAMYEEGVLSTGHYIETDRSALVGQYIGQTEQNTSDILHKALGGVLFVDEAYSLVGDDSDFGGKALDTIVKFMEDNRNDIMIIFAGYPTEMDKLLQMNSGLKSRFPNVFHFEDYTSEEIVKIGTMMLENDSFNFNHEMYSELINETYNLYGDNSNGRWIRNVNEKLERIVAKRVMNERSDEINLITNNDLEELDKTFKQS